MFTDYPKWIVNIGFIILLILIIPQMIIIFLLLNSRFYLIMAKLNKLQFNPPSVGVYRSNTILSQYNSNTLSNSTEDNFKSVTAFTTDINPMPKEFEWIFDRP